MKTKIIMLCFLAAVSFSLKAQYVTIPDVHFVNWLNLNIPSAMLGNQMDTTNVMVTSLINMNISSDTLCDLEGIQYFKSLRALNCSNNKIDTLLSLPDSLESLICSGNLLTYLQEIPDSVTVFDCAQNQLDSLPALPVTLIFFDCHNNSLNSLLTLPDSITYFDCSGNQLTSLPALPTSLPNLNCAENQLTNLPALPLTIASINCENNLLVSLPALPASLITLNCGSNLLTALPTLPSGAITVECYFNQLSALPALPDSLITLICGGNLLTMLPTLPDSLITLKCYGNQLTFLPALPASLQYLDCGNNSILNLPALAGSLTYLNCEFNQLSVLPTLTSSIQTLNCSSNLLSGIPTLPASLIYLSCSSNPLINLPSLPASLYFLDCSNATLDSLPVLSSSLSQLNCSYNSLVTLPASPASLYILYCNNNLLSSLPVLPASINYLICNDNNINCFEEFPDNLFLLTINNNPFTCLPNYLPVMDAQTLAYPLCVIGDSVYNPNACIAAKGIVGFTYTDMNTNCMKDSLDGILTNIAVQLYDNSGVFIGQTYTAENGIYHFPKPIGIYDVRIDTTGMPISPQCASPGYDSTVTLTSVDPLITNVDFGFNCKPGFDVGVRSVSHCGLVFPGEAHKLKIDAGDMTQWYNMACAAGVSGQVEMIITGPVTLTGLTTGALTPSIMGSTYTYSIADFGAIINTLAFGLILTVDPTAGSGNQICVQINVTPAGGDNDSTNNSFVFCYEVVNSHDPNMKETFPEEVPLNYNDWLTYTIHFQNTGNAPAININLRDTLDNQLDLSSFEVIGYSHSNHVVQNGNELMIQFPNIYLSDSTSSADSSKGFFQYRIKPLSGLGCGSEIHNTASIYFDFNEPIVTNTTINSYPQAPASPMLADTTVCYSGSLTFNFISADDTINWYNSGSSLLYSGNSFTLDNINTSTTLFVQVVSPNGCSSNIEDLNISVLPRVVSPLLSLNDTLCFTDTLIFSASTVSGWNYHWSGPAGFVSSIEDPIISSLSKNNSGTYNLYVSNGQCVSDTAFVYIKIEDLPVIAVTNNPDICLGDSIDLNVSGNLNTIVWGTGEVNQTITVSPNETTLFYVNGTNICGTVEQNILVTVNIPPVSFTRDAILISGESIQLNAEGGNLYTWYPDSGISCSDCSDPIVSISEDQSYSVIVTDINGCSDTSSFLVKVVEEANTIYLPNSFTPNYDGLNDEFKLTGKDIKNVHMIIYQRSGDKIFESTDLNKGWDGTYKGNILNSEVFVYIIHVTFNNEEKRKFKGPVTIVR